MRIEVGRPWELGHEVDRQHRGREQGREGANEREPCERRGDERQIERAVGHREMLEERAGMREQMHDHRGRIATEPTEMKLERSMLRRVARRSVSWTCSPTRAATA